MEKESRMAGRGNDKDLTLKGDRGGCGRWCWCINGDNSHSTISEGIAGPILANEDRNKHIVVFLERAGKPGGGKGILLGENKTFTLATAQIMRVSYEEEGDREKEGMETQQNRYIVRRLTPTECERLQGFPDGWTDIPYKGKEHPANSNRYEALGNSMAVPVMRWIGRRIEWALSHPVTKTKEAQGIPLTEREGAAGQMLLF